jgi:Tfp pilus assembly protein FimT
MVELMIVVALIGVVASIGPKVFTDVTRFLRMTTARHEIQRDSKNAISMINRNLRQAKASTVVISQITGQPPYSRINFDKYIDESTSKAMSFYQQGEKFYSVDNGSTRAVCGGLRYLAFTYPRTDDDGVISVSMTFEKATYQGQSKALQLAVEKVRVMND